MKCSDNIVHCLKRLATKVTNEKNVSNIEGDTKNDLICFIADNLNISGEKIDITSKFSQPVVNADKYNGVCTVGGLKSNANYQINLNVNVTAKASGTTLGIIATIDIPEDMRSFASRHEIAYYIILHEETQSYKSGVVGLIHSYGEATAQLQLLDAVSIQEGDTIIFGTQFNFIA